MRVQGFCQFSCRWTKVLCLCGPILTTLLAWLLLQVHNQSADIAVIKVKVERIEADLAAIREKLETTRVAER